MVHDAGDRRCDDRCVKHPSTTRFTLSTPTAVGIATYQIREQAINAARWVALRSGEPVDVTSERTGHVWSVLPTD
jgi:hypothetical protein